MGRDAYLTNPIQVHVLRTALETSLPMPKGLQATAVLSESASAEPRATSVDVAVLEALVGDNKETTCVILEDYLLAARQQAAALHTAFVDGDTYTVGAIGQYKF